MWDFFSGLFFVLEISFFSFLNICNYDVNLLFVSDYEIFLFLLFDGEVKLIDDLL